MKCRASGALSGWLGYSSSAASKSALSTGSTVHDLWLDFAVARAFLGSADDGLHLPELRTLGDSARVTLDWDVPWPDRPRRLAPRVPVSPTGASYVAKTAHSPKSTSVVFSVDGAKTFHKWPVRVKQINAEGRDVWVDATPDMITHIRWTLSGALAPADEIAFSYRAEVK